MAISSEMSEAAKTARDSLSIGVMNQFGLLKLKGPDAENFLQNRLTSDVKSLNVGDSQFTAILNQKGQVQSYFLLSRVTDICYLGVVPLQEAPIAVNELRKYKVTEDLEISDRSGTYAYIAVQGKRALDLVKNLLPPEPLAPFKDGEHRVLKMLDGSWLDITRISLTGDEGYLISTSRSAPEPLLEKVKAAAQEIPYTELTPQLLEVLRIEAGIPLMDVDMDNRTLLPETGLEQKAVSYNKGCYLGQETIARIKTYGTVQKALVGLMLKPGDPIPSLNTECVVDGKTVGVFKSGIESPTLGCPIVMVYLNKEERIPGKVLNFTYHGRNFEGTVKLLPFISSEESSQKANILLEKGLLAYAQNREEEAVANLRESLALNPALDDAYEALGVVLSKQEKYQEAIELMEKLVELDPNRVMAHTNLSVYYMKIGNKERAEEEKAKATSLSMKAAVIEAEEKAREEEERTRREQISKDRIELFKKALTIEENDPLANFGLGSSYLDLRQYNDAIVPFIKAIQALPNYTAAYLSLGKAFEGVSKIEEAKATYRRGIEVAARRRDQAPLEEMEKRLKILEN